MVRLNAYRMMVLSVWLGLISIVFVSAPHVCHALCATVKIEIQQELTLERQAFDAHMRINNGLSTVPIEEVAVVVSFYDEDGNPVEASSDPDDTSASFFIRLDTMENIDGVDGTGAVSPETSADIHWLIIPAPGASNGLESGTMYYVGATLTYTAAGQSETIDVTPDYIFVKPMPQLILDYFLPTDIYGDDAWSTEVEPPVPFFLGLRINNDGDGYARSLKVESAQPEIVGNETGLLIGFQIDGSSVNGEPATDSLLVDFGDIPPKSAAMARWIMSCSLSGRFVDFGAEFSHADELGGKLTSLIAEDDIRTHFLVRSVLVDAEGRDSIEDFLANDDDVYRVYESDNVETDVTNQTSYANLSAQGSTYLLSTPATQGFMYAQVTDPTNGNMVVKEAIRSDGKRIKAANVWFSKTRAGSGPWQYFLNIFDYNTPGEYTIVLQSAADLPQPPVIMFIPERTRVEGQQLSFIVEATDPNGTTPMLFAERLPVGASFTDQGDGSAIFDWTPGMGQAGRYVVRIVASDGVLESSRQAVIRIFSQDDSDGDGMLDSWENEHFGSLDRDGTGDFDGDGILDIDEFSNNLDPEASQSAPGVPEIIDPQDGDHIDELTPQFIIANSMDPEGDDITYTFELFSDEAFKDQLYSETNVPEQAGTTIWTVPEPLADNSYFYWRVRAADATGSSNWAYGRFFTDTQNEAPSEPVLNSPADNLDVDTLQPTLEIINAQDPDGELLTYNFEVYADVDMAVLSTSVEGVTAGEENRTTWTVDTPLEEGVVYYWRAVAVDSRGAATSSPLFSFWANTANTAPPIPILESPANGSEITTPYIDLTIINVEDPDSNDVSYTFELDTDYTFTGESKMTSGWMAPMEPNTIWSHQDLAENTQYNWRVKSSDGTTESPWGTGRFFVNTFNEAPPIPELKNPGEGAWVNTQTPILSAHPVTDVDQDVVFYRFEIYYDEELSDVAGYAETNEPIWDAISPLPPSTWYYWRVQAVDAHGIPGEWSETGSFFVKVNGIDQPPQLIFLSPAEEIHTNAQGISIRWSDSDPDSNADIALYYDTDDNGADGVLITDGITEDIDGTDDYYTWDISTLEGTYSIYAIISDASSSETVYCPATITIDHTPPVISVVPAGDTFSDPVQVTLTTDEPATIYYTLDGSEPDINAEQYTTPLNISEDTSLGLMAIDEAGNQSASQTETYTFEAADIAVTIQTDKGRQLNGVRVYAFTSSGSYTGNHAVTDGQGEAHFDPELFSEGTYQFRADYLGNQFWSVEVTLPDNHSVTLEIPEEPVTVTVETAAGAVENVRVYLFSETGSYLGIYLITDADGQVVFNLPSGMTFSFRADLYGNPYWSDATTVDGGGVNIAPVNAGGGQWLVTVNKAEDQPLTGRRVYLFNTAGSYLGHYANTDELGQVRFDVPSGDYRLRVDYLGYQFWSADANVTTDTSAMVTIAHQNIQVAVSEIFEQSQTPVEGINVYLFSEAGSYLGLRNSTNSQGDTTFDLPEMAFKVRADYLGKQYWSEVFTWQDPTINIPTADAQVTVSGAGYPLEGVRVYVFSDTGSYLGRYADTDGDGQCLFRLPEGTYRFRADYQGSQFWSADETLAADQFHAIGLSTGGGSFSFTVLTQADQPLAGANGYLFNAAGSYLGLQGTTDENGQLSFNLSDGSYQLRIDYLGYQFWSDVVQVPDSLAAEMTIVHTAVEVSVVTAAGPAQAVRVYLFDADGAYQGRYLETDDQGQVIYNLPSGVEYMFRADLFGNQYWSDPIQVPVQAPESGPAPVDIDTGGGVLELVVQDSDASPMENLNVYLFSSEGSYLGLQATTDETGSALFDVPDGTYKLRVDYLGYSYWTEAIQVSEDIQVVLGIEHQPVAITVQGRFQDVYTPYSGVRVYLFTATGSYLGQYQETGADGTAAFSLPNQGYLVRADYQGGQYWSNTINWNDQEINIPMAEALVDVTGAGLPQQGITVYVFSESGAYLGMQSTTDEAGQSAIKLPAGTYQFRADYQGNQYWSGPQVLAADQSTNIVVSVGGGTFSLTVRQDTDTPLAGVRCYVFNEAGSYLGLFGATDELGEVRFNLAEGTFQFRADYLGYQHWSQNIAVPGLLSAAIDVPHQDVTVTFRGTFLEINDPLEGQRIYLFTPSGSYLGVNHLTDENGQAVFHLPDQAYQVRADYLGVRYWSETFQSQDVDVQVPQGAVEIHVRRDSAGVGDVRVYLFNAEDTYLGRYEITESRGWAAFYLPQGSYRFRADVEGMQHWTSVVELAADQIVGVDIDVP